ncbi:hypothetical protein QQ045_022957 [Rhodiola kirilowii]
MKHGMCCPKKRSRAPYDLTRKGKKISTSEDPSFADAITSTQVPFAGVHFYDFFNNNVADPTTPSTPLSPTPAPKQKNSTKVPVDRFPNDMLDKGPVHSIPMHQARQGTSWSNPKPHARQGTSPSAPKPQPRPGTSSLLSN